MDSGDRAAGRRRRVSRGADFDRAYRQGRSHANRYLVLYAFANGDGGKPRLGLSVGRRVGRAVVRNRVKRLLREAFWACAGGLPQGHDFVLLARAEAAELAERRGEAGVEEALRDLLSAAGFGETEAR